MTAWGPGEGNRPSDPAGRPGPDQPSGTPWGGPSGAPTPAPAEPVPAPAEPVPGGPPLGGPAPTGAAAAEPKARALARVGAVLLALLLAFGAAVMIVAMVQIADAPLCEDVSLFTTEDECVDASGAGKTAVLAFGFPGGVLAAIAAFLAIAFAVRARGGRLLAMIAIPAVVLCVVSIIVTRMV